MITSAIFVFVCCIAGLVWAVYTWNKVKAVETGDKLNAALMEEDRKV